MRIPLRSLSLSLLSLFFPLAIHAAQPRAELTIERLNSHGHGPRYSVQFVLGKDQKVYCSANHMPFHAVDVAGFGIKEVPFNLNREGDCKGKGRALWVSGGKKSKGCYVPSENAILERVLQGCLTL